MCHVHWGCFANFLSFFFCRKATAAGRLQVIGVSGQACHAPASTLRLDKPSTALSVPNRTVGDTRRWGPRVGELSGLGSVFHGSLEPPQLLFFKNKTSFQLRISFLPQCFVTIQSDSVLIRNLKFFLLATF